MTVLETQSDTVSDTDYLMRNRGPCYHSALHLNEQYGYMGGFALRIRDKVSDLNRKQRLEVRQVAALIYLPNRKSISRTKERA